MRRALFVIAALVAAIAVAIFAALALIPDTVYRDEIAKAAREATGRDVTIEGEIGLSLYPVLGVKAQGVRLANAPGFEEPYFARMKELDAGVKLWPLFSGKVEIARFALVEPDIALEVDAKGNNNWAFETGEQAPAPSEPAAEPGGAEISDISIGTVRLMDGRVRYANKQSGEKWEASAINVTIELPTLDDPLNVDGNATWKGEKVALSLRAEKPRALIEGAQSPLALDVNTDLLKLSFAGAATLGEEVALSGPVDLSTRSLRKLLSWLSEPMAAGKTLGAFALKGDLSVNGDVTRIDNAALSLDGMTGKGRLSVNTASARARPLIEAVLGLDRLDLDPYLGDESPAPAMSGSGGSAGGTSSASASSGWSSERMDLSSLKEADADLSVTAGKVSFAGMALGQSTLSVRLRNGVLSADLPNLALYGGQGSGQLVLDASGATPALNATLSFNAIAVEPFLRDTSEFDRLNGTGAMTLSLTSRGASERAMMESLNGRGSLKLVNGAMRGVNLDAMMRDVSNLVTKGQLSQGIYTGAALGPSQQTEFSEFGGTFTIQNGLLANNDLVLVNRELRVSGAGTTSIVSRTVDYRLVSKLMESVEGQEGAPQVTASVPIHVRGTWDSLKFQPDAKALVVGVLKGVSEALGAGEDPLKGALKGLFGRPGATQKEESAQPSDAGQESSSGEGTWAPNGTKVDEGGSDSAPAEEGATAEEKAPTPEEQIRNIFQGIFKED